MPSSAPHAGTVGVLAVSWGFWRSVAETVCVGLLGALLQFRAGGDLADRDSRAAGISRKCLVGDRSKANIAPRQRGTKQSPQAS